MCSGVEVVKPLQFICHWSQCCCNATAGFHCCTELPVNELDFVTYTISITGCTVSVRGMYAVLLLFENMASLLPLCRNRTPGASSPAFGGVAPSPLRPSAEILVTWAWVMTSSSALSSW